MKEENRNKNKTCEDEQSERKSNKTKTKLLSRAFVFSASSSPLHLLSLPDFFLSPPPSLSLSKQRVKNKIKCHIISPDWLEASSPPASDEPWDNHCTPCSRSKFFLSSFFRPWANRCTWSKICEGFLSLAPFSKIIIIIIIIIMNCCQNVSRKSKLTGRNRDRTGDLLICSQMVYHWAMDPSACLRVFD